LLDSLDTVLQFTRTMTWNGKHPVVALVTTTYQTGVTLTKDAMETVEAHLQRLPVLGVCPRISVSGSVHPGLTCRFACPDGAGF
jgi:hypothetical protein